MGKAPPQHHHIDRRAAQIVASTDDNDADDLLSTGDTAGWLGVSTQFLEIGRSRGYGPPFVRLGSRKVMYRRSDTIAWLKKRTFTSTKEYNAKRRRLAR
jgi:hypothetical protein